MGQPRLKWGQVRAYFLRHGYEITESGGDKIIKAPKDGSGQRTRQQVRIGHTSSRNDGTEMLRCYTSAIRRAFGVSDEDIRNG